MPPTVLFSVLAVPVELAGVAEPVEDPVWLPLDEAVDGLAVADVGFVVLVVPELVVTAVDALLVPFDKVKALRSTGTTPGQAFMHSCVGIQSFGFSPLLPG